MRKDQVIHNNKIPTWQDYILIMKYLQNNSMVFNP